MDWCKSPRAVGSRISASGLNQRFTQQASQMLLHVLTRLVSQQQQHLLTSDTQELLRSFSAVWLEDSSSIYLPEDLADVWLGNGGGGANSKAAVKLFVRLDLRQGTLQGPMLTDGRHSDKRSPLSLDEIPVGGLSIADLGFSDGSRFRALHGQSAGQRRYFVTRWPLGVVLQTRSKHRINLRAVAPQSVGERLEMGVVLPTAGNLPVRLLMERVPAEVEQQRRTRLEREARGHPVNEERLFWCGWSIVLTNVPRRLLSFDQVFILLAARWQMERLFCQWKEDGQLDRWRSYDPWRIWCEVSAKLCAMVIQQWLIQLGCWSDPMHSAVKAGQVCRREAGRIMVGLWEGHLESVLTSVLTCMQSGCRLNARQTYPNTAQMLCGQPRQPQPRPAPPKLASRKNRRRTWPAGRGWASRGGKHPPAVRQESQTVST